MTITQEKYPKLLSVYLNPAEDNDPHKIRDHTMVLVARNSAYNRFLNYTIEQKRAAVLAEERAKKPVKGDHGILKLPDDSLQKRQEERRILKEKEEEVKRAEFVKEMKEKRERERAQTIQKARRLLINKQPQCRVINGALLTSECIRELNAQREFELSLKEMDKKKESEYQNNILKDVEMYQNEEKQKSEKQKDKNKIYQEQLIKQIAEIRSNEEKLNQEKMMNEQEDLQNMQKELELMKSIEEQTEKEKKLKVKRLCYEAIEEKEAFKKQQQKLDEMEDEARKLQAAAKFKIQNMHKIDLQLNKMKYVRRMSAIANRLGRIKNKFDPEIEEERRKIAEKEKEAAEQQRKENKEKKREKMRLEIEQYRQQQMEMKKKRLKEKEQMLLWDILDRIQKKKFDQEVEQRELKKRAERKKKYAEELLRQMQEKNEQEMAEKEEQNDSTELENITQFNNKQILSYADEVLKESTGVRPLFPIIKAIQRVKKELGELPPKEFDESEAPPPIQNKRKKRPVCVPDVRESQIYYLG